MDWLEDIENHAFMLFGVSLQRALDLHIDACRAEDHFPGWMAKIIRNDCLQALRHYRRSHDPAVELRESHLATDRGTPIDVKIDLSQVVEQLEAMERDVFVLYLMGYTTTEIATAKGIGYSKAYRILKRVKRSVRRDLDR